MLYEVKAKCGHVGRDWYVIKSFAIEADSGKEAAEIAKNKPRVKHHHRDAIQQVTPIDSIRYQEISVMNSADPYFRCHSIQDQRAFCPDLDLLPEASTVEKRERKDSKGTAVYWKKQRIRNPKKYINNYCFDEDYAS